MFATDHKRIKVSKGAAVKSSLCEIRKDLAVDLVHRQTRITVPYEGQLRSFRRRGLYRSGIVPNGLAAISRRRKLKLISTMSALHPTTSVRPKSFDAPIHLDNRVRDTNTSKDPSQVAAHRGSFRNEHNSFLARGNPNCRPLTLLILGVLWMIDWLATSRYDFWGCQDNLLRVLL